MKLYQPIKIGKLELKNRIIMAAMGNQLNRKEDGSRSEDGTPQEELISYYARRAAGGTGLLITEMTRCDLPRFPFGGIGLWREECIPSLSHLVSAVKSYDTKICVQLHQWGSWNYPQRSRLLRPDQSPPKSPYPGPLELSKEEIWQKAEKYAQAARRARLAGFDAVELHGAHQHPLLAQFLSAHMNQRNDEYGGSPQNRARFAQEVIRRCKEEAGEDFPIIFRFSADEHEKDGMIREEAKIIAQLLVEAGADALHVSAGTMSSLEWTVPPHLLPVGVNIYLAEEVKKVVSVPVIAVGRITSPRLAESILQQGKADLIALGRALLADPDWARKGLEGRDREIRVCLGCNSCYDSVRPIGLWCLLNPELGRRREFQEESTKVIKPKRVMVVGAGPAGIEAARVAAQKGHKVALYEESRVRGGAWSWHLQSWIAQKCRALKEAGVTIELGKRLTPALLEDLNPEVVLATERAIPWIPDIPGIRQDNVFTADEVLMGEVELKGSAAVLGGGSQGCQLAEFLVKRGVAVIMVERGNVIGMDMGILHQPIISSQLAEQGVQIFTGLEVIGIEGKKIICLDGKGNRKTFEVDNMIVALGYKTDNGFLDLLKGKGRELHSLPYCGSPRYALEAVHAGSAAARRIGREELQ